METNDLVTMFHDLARSQKALTEIALGQKGVQGPLGPNSVLITTIICAALAPTLTGFANWLKSRSVERIVNGDRMQLNLKVIELEKAKAVLEEKERAMGEAQAKAGVQATAKAEGMAAGKAEQKTN